MHRHRKSFARDGRRTWGSASVHLVGRTITIAVATLATYLATGVTGSPDLAGAATAPSASAAPASGLLDKQSVAVEFTGFADGGVSIRQCRSNPDPDPAKFTLSSNCALQVNGSTAGGVGSASYTIVVGTVGSFTCGPGKPCTIGVRGNKPGGGSSVAYAPITFAAPPTETTTTTTSTTLPATTTTTLPPRELPGDCPPGTTEKIAGTGAAGFEIAYQRWVRDVCRSPLDLNVDYSPRSSTMGRIEYARRGVDYAVTAAPFTASELAALEAPIPDDGFGGGTDGEPNPRRDFVYVPVAVSGVSIVYNLWIDGWHVTDLQLAPDTLAGLLTGRIGNLNHELIARDNPHLVKAGQTRIRSMLIAPFARGGQSADTWALTSWLHTDPAATSVWKQAGAQFQVGPTETYPAEVGVGSFGAVNLLVQNVIRPDGFEQNTTFSIGFVDSSVAAESSLPVARLRNAAGQFVAPTAASLAAAADAAIPVAGAHGTTFQPNYGSTDALAYPLTRVQYAIAPTTDLTIAKSRVLHALLEYSTGTGQSLVAGAEVLPYGYVPLNSAMVAAAKDAIDRIPTEETPVPTTTTTVATGTTTTTAATRTTTTTRPDHQRPGSDDGDDPVDTGGDSDGGTWDDGAWDDSGFDSGFDSFSWDSASGGGWDTSGSFEDGTGTGSGGGAFGDDATGVGAFVADPIGFTTGLLGSPRALSTILVAAVGGVTLLAGPALQISAKRGGRKRRRDEKAGTTDAGLATGGGSE